MTSAEQAELIQLIRLKADVDHLQAACCDGKQKFPTPADARLSIRPRVRHIVMTYRCRICGSWHVGSNDRFVRLRKMHARVVNE